MGSHSLTRITIRKDPTKTWIAPMLILVLNVKPRSVIGAIREGYSDSFIRSMIFSNSPSVTKEVYLKRVVGKG